MEIKSFERDRASVEAGQWVGEIPNCGDLRLKVRGLSSEDAILFRSKLERAVPRSERNADGSLKPEPAYRVFTKLLAEKILLDWDNLTQDGKVLKYDRKLADAWFADKKMMAFHDAVVYSAQVVDLGLDQTREELEKN